LQSAQDASKAESGVIVAVYQDGPSQRFLLVAGTHLVELASETLFAVLDEPGNLPGERTGLPLGRVTTHSN
jgi:hypothetical protein